MSGMNAEEMAFWMSWCIEEYAAAKNRTDADVAKEFEEKGALQFLSDHGDILHTQGKDYIIHSLDAFLSR